MRRRVLCDSLGAPDPNAIFARPDVDTPEYIAEHTIRERVAVKTSGGSCTGCHAMINSLGFVLENFDLIGRFRTTEKAYSADFKVIAEHPISSGVSGLYIDTNGPDSANSAEEFADILATSDKGSACFARQTFRYFNFRMEDIIQDGCSLKGIRDSIVGPNGSIAEGLEQIVLSPAFNKKVVKGD